MFAKQRLYLTADKVRLVPEGDDDAATLYASPGDEIPESAVDLFGLIDGALPPPAPPAPTPAPDTTTPITKPKGRTMKPQGENKEAKASADKGGDADETKGAPPPETDAAQGEG